MRRAAGVDRGSTLRSADGPGDDGVRLERPRAARRDAVPTCARTARRWECGLLVVLMGVSACSTDQPKALHGVDAGAPAAVVVDAGAPDAGPPTAPPVRDAGPATAAAVDAGSASAASTGTPSDAPDRPVAAPKGSVFDRVLAKPKDRGTEPAELKALIEQRTGLKVELTRRTAGRWVLIQLAAVPGGRTEQDQRDAIRALERLGLFEVVEGDRLMKVKTP